MGFFFFSSAPVGHRRQLGCEMEGLWQGCREGHNCLPRVMFQRKLRVGWECSDSLGTLMAPSGS